MISVRGWVLIASGLQAIGNFWKLLETNLNEGLLQTRVSRILRKRSFVSHFQEPAYSFPTTYSWPATSPWWERDLLKIVEEALE